MCALFEFGLACVFVRVCLHVCLHVCLCVCWHLCVHFYIHTRVNHSVTNPTGTPWTASVAVEKLMSVLTAESILMDLALPQEHILALLRSEPRLSLESVFDITTFYQITKNQ